MFSKNLLIISIACILSLGSMSCGKRELEMSLNTSTNAYPVISENTNYTLDFGNSPEEEVLVNSVTNIDMSSIGDDQMDTAHLEALVLKAQDGDLAFIRSVKCYIKTKRSSSSTPRLIASGSQDKLSSDFKSIRLDVLADVDLAEYLRQDFVISIEIRGTIPSSNTSIFGDLSLKMRLKL